MLFAFEQDSNSFSRVFLFLTIPWRLTVAALRSVPADFNVSSSDFNCESVVQYRVTVFAVTVVFLASVHAPVLSVWNVSTVEIKADIPKIWGGFEDNYTFLIA